MAIYRWFLLIVLFKNINCSITNDIVIETNVGKIKGAKASDGDYYMYLGIHYAMVGDNPFGVSTPYPPFHDTFDAVEDTIMCPQLNKKLGLVTGITDCLRLNIYVPTSANLTNRLPVMIWLHGGRFEINYAGRAIFGPHYLVPHNIILVTVNYRLGPYGFMCLDIPEVSGNQGLKDQYLAIKWVKENIEAFGGDSNQITLFGQSAGGHSIDLHLMSPRQILFNKIILQSGSAQSLTVLYEPDKSAALKIASYAGLQTNSTKEAIRFLSLTDVKIVIDAAKHYQIHFKPCVEAQYTNADPFIINSWINPKVPKVKNIPVLMGFNKIEYAGIFFPKKERFLSNPTTVKDHLEQVFDFSNQQSEEAASLVSHFYFGDNKIDENTTWSLVRFLSDFTYIHPIHRTLSKYLEYGAKSVYFYMMSYVGERNMLITNNYDEYQPNDNSCCASHNDELNYLFHKENKPEMSNTDRLIMESMTTMWTNFAKYSNPTPEVSELLPVKWEPATKDEYSYMNINTELTVQKRPLHQRMTFWDLFYKHYYNIQKRFD